MAMIFRQPGKTGIGIKADDSACLENGKICHSSSNERKIKMRLNSVIFFLCAGIGTSALIEKAFSTDRGIYGSHEQANQHRNVSQQMEEVDYIDVDAFMEEENTQNDLTNFTIPDYGDAYTVNLSIQQVANRSMEEVNRNVDERQDAVIENGVIDFKDILERYNRVGYLRGYDYITSCIDRSIKKPKPIQIDIEEKRRDQKIKKFAKPYNCINLKCCMEGNEYLQFLDQDNCYLNRVRAINVYYDIRSPRRRKLEELFFNKISNGEIVYYRKNELQIVAREVGKYRVIGNCDRIGKIFASDDNCVAIELPSSLKRINKEAFAKWTALRNIEIPSNVSRIGQKAFSECTSLEKIVIPSSVKSLGLGIFYNCSALTRVDMRANITTIPMHAFKLCTSLQSINIPERVTSIEYYAFFGCSNLSVITIPSNVKSLAVNAFDECIGLKSITAYMSIKNLEHWPLFMDCSNLQTVNIIYDGNVSERDKNIIVCKLPEVVKNIKFIKMD